MDIAPSRAAVLQALDTVKDPRSGQGLAMAGLVRGLSIREGRVGFMLEVAPADAQAYAAVRDQAEAALAALPGIRQAQVVLTTEDLPPTPAPPPRRATVAADPAAALRPPAAARRPDHVRRVIAVASAKGGVGKSTVAANLAAAFAALGLRTGLADADIYGPSIPQMMGVSGQPRMDADKRMIPALAHGVKVTSIGLIVEETSAMIWRGPMASSAVNQLVHETAWGTADEPLDVLVLDLPPGTGDILLTLAQKVAIDGAVLVSTPQAVALSDVRRGAVMFAKVGVPVLGVVENMAYFPDPSTGAPIEIFGRGGAARLAADLAVPLLAELPIDIAVRQGGDAGTPAVVTAPDSPVGRAILDMARRLAR